MPTFLPAKTSLATSTSMHNAFLCGGASQRVHVARVCSSRLPTSRNIQVLATTGAEPQKDVSRGVKSWFSNLVKANSAGASAEKEAADLVEPLTREEEMKQRWNLWWLLPIEPYSIRKTVRSEVVPGIMWSFEQLLGAVRININQRMTVIKLQGGGLWVHSPVAPTLECMELLEELVALHGEVKYIVNPTYAVEHKVYFGAMAKQYPEAELWVAPSLWAYPLNLPISWQLGVPLRKIFTIDSTADTPWIQEIEHRTLGPLPLQIGNFVETAFFHKRTRTLIVTDVVVNVPREPPAICLADPTALLFESRDNPSEKMENTSASRRKGWWKSVLLALYIKPAVLDLESDGFQWVEGWQNSFEAVQGRTLVAPLLSLLLLNRHPEKVIAWADEVGLWDFQRVVPAHFATASCNPREFRSAFAFLEESQPVPRVATLPALVARLMGRDKKPRNSIDMNVDSEFLQNIDQFITDKGLAAPARKLVANTK